MIKKDKLQVEQSLLKFTDQLKESWTQTQKAEIYKIGTKPVIICGMGGSGLAGRIISGLFENRIKNQIYVHSDYGLPSWVDRKWLVILNSYSGNTEETISSYEEAKRRGIQTLIVTCGGKLGERVKEGEKGVILEPSTNPTGYPKTGLGISLGGLMAVLAKSAIIKIDKNEFEQSVDEVEKIRNEWFSSTKNLPQQISNFIGSGIPVLISSRPFLGSLYAARNVINEIGRTFCVFFDLPELDHHLIEATAFPKELKNKIKYLFFYSDFAHQRVKLRFKLTQEMFEDQKLYTHQIKLVGEKMLTQALELSHLGAWTAFYLSVANKQDPGPEPWIEKFKSKLNYE